MVPGQQTLLWLAAALAAVVGVVGPSVATRSSTESVLPELEAQSRQGLFENRPTMVRSWHSRLGARQQVVSGQQALPGPQARSFHGDGPVVRNGSAPFQCCSASCINMVYGIESCFCENPRRVIHTYGCTLYKEYRPRVTHTFFVWKAHRRRGRVYKQPQ